MLAQLGASVAEDERIRLAGEYVIGSRTHQVQGSLPPLALLPGTV